MLKNVKETKILDGIRFNISRKVENGFIYKNIKFSDKHKDYNFNEKVKVITLADFTKLLNFAGMRVINQFGNYNLDLYNPQQSDRLIIIAKKWK